MKRLLTLSLLVALTITLFSACKDNSKKGPEYTSAYICPMHCEGSGSSEPGNCPVCNMAYVKNEDYQGDQDDHAGHDHSADDGHDHGDMQEAESQDTTGASEDMDMEEGQDGDDMDEGDQEEGDQKEQ